MILAACCKKITYASIPLTEERRRLLVQLVTATVMSPEFLHIQAP